MVKDADECRAAGSHREADARASPGSRHSSARGRAHWPAGGRHHLRWVDAPRCCSESRGHSTLHAVSTDMRGYRSTVESVGWLTRACSGRRYAPPLNQWNLCFDQIAKEFSAALLETRPRCWQESWML